MSLFSWILSAGQTIKPLYHSTKEKQGAKEKHGIKDKEAANLRPWQGDNQYLVDFGGIRTPTASQTLQWPIGRAQQPIQD